MPRRRRSSPSTGQRVSKNYPNRTDLNASASMTQTPGGPDMPAPPAATDPTVSTGTLKIPSVNAPLPVVALHEPTQRPLEPVTAGLPINSGQSGNIHGLVLDNATVQDTLRGVGSAHPNDDILGLIRQLGPVGRQ